MSKHRCSRRKSQTRRTGRWSCHSADASAASSQWSASSSLRCSTCHIHTRCAFPQHVTPPAHPQVLLLFLLLHALFLLSPFPALQAFSTASSPTSPGLHHWQVPKGAHSVSIGGPTGAAVPSSASSGAAARGRRTAPGAATRAKRVKKNVDGFIGKWASKEFGGR
jgi:hypothetical protein